MSSFTAWSFMAPVFTPIPYMKGAIATRVMHSPMTVRAESPKCGKILSSSGPVYAFAARSMAIIMTPYITMRLT